MNLPAMGAKNGVKDVFLQMDWMHGFGDGTGGIDGSGSHSHIPRLDALSAVAPPSPRTTSHCTSMWGTHIRAWGFPTSFLIRRTLTVTCWLKADRTSKNRP